MIASENRKGIFVLLLFFCFFFYVASPLSCQFGKNSIEIGSSHGGTRLFLLDFIFSNLALPGPSKDSTHPDFGFLIRKARAILPEEVIKRIIPIYKSVVSGFLVCAFSYSQSECFFQGERLWAWEYAYFSASGVSPPLSIA